MSSHSKAFRLLQIISRALDALTLPHRAWFIHRRFGVSYGYAKEVLALVDMVDRAEIGEATFEVLGQAIQEKYPNDAAHGRALEW